MSPQAKKAWAQVLHQLPTAAVVTVIFASGGWKGSVEGAIERHDCEIVELHAANMLQDEKDEALETRIVELEAIARERWLQIQSLQANQGDIREMVSEIYHMMLEDRQ
jgi:hypothetical protein